MKDYSALFHIFQHAVTNSVTLYFPHYTLPWILLVDASDYAVGAVLFQEYTDQLHNVINQPIAFLSHEFSGAAINWDTFKQEAYVPQLIFYTLEFLNSLTTSVAKNSFLKLTIETCFG